jgi:hypothetical protein
MSCFHPENLMQSGNMSLGLWRMPPRSCDLLDVISSSLKGPNLRLCLKLVDILLIWIGPVLFWSYRGEPRVAFQ